MADRYSARTAHTLDTGHSVPLLFNKCKMSCHRVALEHCDSIVAETGDIYILPVRTYRYRIGTTKAVYSRDAIALNFEKGQSARHRIALKHRHGVVGNARSIEVFTFRTHHDSFNETQTIDATEALRIGLVVEVTSEGRHEASALHLADEALKGAPLALAAQKQLFDDALGMPLEAVQDFETQMSFRLTQTEDHQEAKRAFAAKRKPEFKGK